MSDQRSSKKAFETRDLNALIPFPLQDATFPPCTEEEDEALAEDIRENGLKHPIEVLPENSAGFPADTILAGHRRRDALVRLDKSKFKVLVRYDLADKDAATIELLFIDDNDKRRHLSRLGKARVALRRFEIERDREPGELKPWEEGQARDRVGKHIGMGGRNAQRYLNVLKTPLSVQHAFEVGQLSLTHSAKVAGLSESTQQEIDKELQLGAEPKKVITKFLGMKKGHRSRRTVIAGYLKGIKRALGEVDGFDVGDMSVRLNRDELQALSNANKHCVELIRAHKRTRKMDQQVIEEAKRIQQN